MLSHRLITGTCLVLGIILVFWLVLVQKSQGQNKVQLGGKASLVLTSIGKEGEPFENAKLGWQMGLVGKKYISDLGWLILHFTMTRF